MSKILASIADAEWLADIAESNQDAKSAEKIRNTATAARDEHAEMVDVIRDLIGSGYHRGSGYPEPECAMPDGGDCSCERGPAVVRAKALLSRVGGGS